MVGAIELEGILKNVWPKILALGSKVAVPLGLAMNR